MPHYAIPDAPPKKGEPAKTRAFKPDPPLVDCQQPRPSDEALPANPTTNDGVAWSIWAVRVYGYVKLWFDKDMIERQCLEDLRKDDVIR